MLFWLLAIFAYFLGAVPFGLLLGRMFADVDVRELGSGNIGATNVNRVLGKKLGAATLLCDVLKGTVSVALAKVLLPDQPIEAAWIGFAAFLGHCFPIYLRFNGGKGVATMFGILLPVSWIAALVSLAVWIAVVKITRVSALGAVSAAMIIPVCIAYFEQSLAIAGIFAMVMIIVLVRHRENLKRIREGNELKV